MFQIEFIEIEKTTIVGGINSILKYKKRKSTFNSVDLKAFGQVHQLNDWSWSDGGFKFFEKPKDRPIWYSKLPFLQYLWHFFTNVNIFLYVPFDCTQLLK